MAPIAMNSARRGGATAADIALRLLQAPNPGNVIRLIGRQRTFATVVLDVVAGTA
jgi:hypothetical protein